MRLDPTSPPQWTAALFIAAASILLLYNTLPVGLAYPRAGTCALLLFSLFALPFWWLRRRLAEHLSVPGAALAVVAVWGATVAVMTSLYGSNAVRGLLATAGGPAWAGQWSPVLGAPVVEEVVKAAGVVLGVAIVWDRVRGVLDGVVLGAFCGVGFQIVEGYAFAMSSTVLNRAGDVVEPVVAVFVVRGVLAGLWSHAVFTAIVGAGIAYAATRKTRRSGWVAAASLVGVIALHALWNSPLGRDGFGLGAVGVLAAVAAKGLPAVLIVVWIIRWAKRNEAPAAALSGAAEGFADEERGRPQAALRSGENETVPPRSERAVPRRHRRCPVASVAQGVRSHPDPLSGGRSAVDATVIGASRVVVFLASRTGADQVGRRFGSGTGGEHGQ
ncbi:PrsW family intramembrane metalloprotease [Glycomyces buryatensis]|uniref:PrsW family intramembrane metalloprotease n=1 Tax=Glycomyces buryatensis TaxID=2570927 RepID=A0A4S8QB40_9ACTN|nr:PrsW family intramembrane metalloprotease [Glycomyces buryatensis]THV41558.1 PrsW family intramembrane metalloprotease [Glycomyces buryatensis]